MRLITRLALYRWRGRYLGFSKGLDPLDKAIEHLTHPVTSLSRQERPADQRGRHEHDEKH